MTSSTLASPGDGAGATAPTDASEGETLAGALEDLLRWARRMPPPGGVSLPALALLARLSAEGPAGISALALAEHVSQPAVSQMVDRLERAGLAARAPGLVDRRSVTVTVTAAGVDLMRERRRARALVIDDLLALAGREDAEALTAAAPALARLVAAATSGPAPPAPGPQPPDRPARPEHRDPHHVTTGEAP